MTSKTQHKKKSDYLFFIQDSELRQKTYTSAFVFNIFFIYRKSENL